MANGAFEIVNAKGLHARASAKFVAVVEAHEATARVTKDGIEADGDSIMGLLMLAASMGTYIDVTTEGADADELFEALKDLVVGQFGEGM